MEQVSLPTAKSLCLLLLQMPSAAASHEQKPKQTNFSSPFLLICANVSKHTRTQLHAELFTQMGVSVHETHSRKSQSARTRVAEAFRNGKGQIMFTSDVSARGMDYPDVSLVIQVGWC